MRSSPAPAQSTPGPDREGGEGGLRFEAFLPSDLATWLLGLIERGLFKDPGEAVFLLLGETRHLFNHPELRKELLSRTLQAWEGR